MENSILTGFFEIYNITYISIIVSGVLGGIIIGALPGLTAAMGVAILLPFTYGMDPVSGLVMLTSIFCGAIYGGSIPAILICTPGTPASAATLIEGTEFAKRGEGGRAIGISTFASAVGGIVSVIILITLAPQLAKVAIKFGSAEYFTLAVFGLTIISSVSDKSIIKGLIVGVFGLIISTVGLDPMTGIGRFTFGSTDLLNGLQVIPVLIGVFAVTQIFIDFEKSYTENRITQKVTKIIPTWADLKISLPVSFRSGIIGTIIGIIPAAGADIGAFVAYGEAKRWSKNPEKFGTGIVEGIAAPEAGNNGVTGGAMVPLLTLGIPGDATTSILIGAFMLQGLQPGPLLFRDHGELVGSIFSGMLLANIFLLIFGLLFINGFTKIVSIKGYLLTPAVFLLCVLGSFAMNRNFFDVIVMMVAGVIGYLFYKFGFPRSPLVLAMILGPMAESNLRRMLLASEGSIAPLFQSPICLFFIAMSILSIFWPLIQNKLCERRNSVTNSNN